MFLTLFLIIYPLFLSFTILFVLFKIIKKTNQIYDLTECSIDYEYPEPLIDFSITNYTSDNEF